MQESPLATTWRLIAQEMLASSTTGEAIVFGGKATPRFAIIAGNGMTAPGGEITTAVSSLSAVRGGTGMRVIGIRPWGYDPYAYYPYDGPIYGYNDLTPDQVIISVQTQLQADGYYAGPIPPFWRGEASRK